MKIRFYFFILCILIFQISCASTAQEQQIKAERKAFQKSPYIIKQPKEYIDRDTENGKSYDPNPRVVVVDEKAGKYEFRWGGYDGKEKVVAYQRHDAIDAVVEAKVKQGQDDKFIYIYNFRMLPDSPSHLGTFFVQTFTESEPDPINLDKKLYLFGKMASVHIFKEGAWWTWGFIGKEEKRIRGGNSVEFQFASTGHPGIVKSKVIGGNWAVEVSDEHMPTELENEIPIFQDLAHGYTIGPDERLSKFSDSEKIKYLLENLPKFQEAGWMGETTAKKYESILKEEDLAKAYEQAEKDLKNEFITSEVFHIIEGLQK